MAKIVGIDPGLIPRSLPKPVFKVKKLLAHEEVRCTSCDGVLPKKRFYGVEQCDHCLTFFGDNDAFSWAGVTNLSPEESRKKLAAANEYKWVMLLKCMMLGAPDGAQIELEAGDIIKVSRVGFVKKGGQCSTERTKLTYSITCMVGPYEVTLFPHEFSAIGFPVIMDMLRAKEIEEQFVSGDDEGGHFTPTPEMREAIKGNFGRLVNAR